MSDLAYTFNEAPDTGECRNPTHHGWEVIGWPTQMVVNPVTDVTVMAICRDEDTARRVAAMLNAEQIPGQISIEVTT